MANDLQSKSQGPFSGNENQQGRTERLWLKILWEIPGGPGCKVDEVNSRYSVLEAVQDTLVNVDQLDYLAKRLDGFCAGEVSEFEAMVR